MKIKIKLPNGAELDFEGDQEEFDRVNEFLAAPPEALNAAMERTKVPEGGEGDGEGQGDDGEVASLEPGYVAERLSMVSASTDIERVTVIAQLAVEAGLGGADYPLVERLYTELGLRKPSRFTKAVSNAKTRNLVRTVGQGVWRPTYLGENYARGLGRATREPRSSQRPKLSIHAGGDEDA